MLRIYRNSRIEKAGSKVRLFRLPGADISATLWKFRLNIFVCLYRGFPLVEAGDEQGEPYDIITQQATGAQAAFRDKENPTDWRVEAIDIKAGDVYVAVFSGPLAQQRAIEYAKYRFSKSGGVANMVDKDHLQGKSVIVRIDGIGKDIQATVTYVESDGFWFSSQQLVAELGQAGLPYGTKAPTVFVPTSRVLWLIAERD